LGAENYFEAVGSLQRRRVSLWFRLAVVHGVGVRGRISPSPRISGLPEPAGECAAGFGWIAGTRDGSFVGDYYQPLSTASPHQIWSAAMVISPVLRGMFGLERDAANKTLTFTPHTPANWTDYKIENIQVGKKRDCDRIPQSSG